MGGALILLCVLLPTILWCDLRNVFVWATTAVTAGYGVIGYLDDYLKIKLKNPRGVPGRYKLLGQFAIGGAVLSYAFLAREHVPADWWDIRFNLGVPFVAFSKHPIVLPAGSTCRSPSSSSSGRRTRSTSPTVSTGWPSARS